MWLFQHINTQMSCSVFFNPPSYRPKASLFRKVLISLHCYHSNLLCHSPRSAPKRTLLVTGGSARFIKWSQSATWWHVASRLMFDTFGDRLKKLEEDITKSENSSRAPLAPFYWSPNNRSPSRCSFDSSHLPWSYWTVWSTATVRRRRIAGGEAKEVTRGL